MLARFILLGKGRHLLFALDRWGDLKLSFIFRLSFVRMINFAILFPTYLDFLANLKLRNQIPLRNFRFSLRL